MASTVAQYLAEARVGQDPGHPRSRSAGAGPPSPPKGGLADLRRGCLSCFWSRNWGVSLTPLLLRGVPARRCPVHGAFPRSGIRPGVYAGSASPLTLLPVPAPFTGLSWLKPTKVSPVNGAGQFAWAICARHKCRAYDRCAGCPVNGAVRNRSVRGQLIEQVGSEDQ